MSALSIFLVIVPELLAIDIILFHIDTIFSLVPLYVKLKAVYTHIWKEYAVVICQLNFRIGKHHERVTVATGCVAVTAGTVLASSLKALCLVCSEVCCSIFLESVKYSIILPMNFHFLCFVLFRLGQFLRYPLPLTVQDRFDRPLAWSPCPSSFLLEASFNRVTLLYNTCSVPCFCSPTIHTTSPSTHCAEASLRSGLANLHCKAEWSEELWSHACPGHTSDKNQTPGGHCTISVWGGLLLEEGWIFEIKSHIVSASLEPTM